MVFSYVNVDSYQKSSYGSSISFFRLFCFSFDNMVRPLYIYSGSFISFQSYDNGRFGNQRDRSTLLIYSGVCALSGSRGRRWGGKGFQLLGTFRFERVRLAINNCLLSHTGAKKGVDSGV